MNPYVKAIIENRIEYLNMQEKDAEEHIENIKSRLNKQELNLKKIREEKAALEEN